MKKLKIKKHKQGKEISDKKWLEETINKEDTEISNSNKELESEALETKNIYIIDNDRTTNTFEDKIYKPSTIKKTLSQTKNSKQKRYSFLWKTVIIMSIIIIIVIIAIFVSLYFVKTYK